MPLDRLLTRALLFILTAGSIMVAVLLGKIWEAERTPVYYPPGSELPTVAPGPVQRR